MHCAVDLKFSDKDIVCMCDTRWLLAARCCSESDHQPDNAGQSGSFWTVFWRGLLRWVYGGVKWRNSGQHSTAKSVQHFLNVFSQKHEPVMTSQIVHAWLRLLRGSLSCRRWRRTAMFSLVDSLKGRPHDRGARGACLYSVSEKFNWLKIVTHEAALTDWSAASCVTVLGKCVWNALPFFVTDSSTISAFKRHLKTYLFARSLSWLPHCCVRVALF